MIKLIIRADDIGYCDGVNRGIKDAVETGLVKSVGLMPNMDEAVNGFEMLKGKDICIGQHTNVLLLLIFYTTSFSNQRTNHKNC